MYNYEFKSKKNKLPAHSLRELAIELNVPHKTLMNAVRAKDAPKYVIQMRHGNARKVIMDSYYEPVAFRKWWNERNGESLDK